MRVGGSSGDSSSSWVTSSWMATRYSVSEMSVLLRVSGIGFSGRWVMEMTDR
jgi:hypothetical protein